jgi:hypothetical protein
VLFCPADSPLVVCGACAVCGGCAYGVPGMVQLSQPHKVPVSLPVRGCLNSEGSIICSQVYSNI